MTGFDPYLLIDKRFQKNRWHVAYEVSSSAGGMMTPGAKWADCIAIGRDHGETEHVVHGIEIKSCRGDVLNEMRNPDKAAPFLGLCNYWWMLCPPKTTDLALSLPPQWGIATQGTDERFEIIRPAPFNADAKLTPIFVYSLLSATLRERHEEARRLRTDEMVRLVASDENLFHEAEEIRERLDARERKFCEQMWGPDA